MLTREASSSASPGLGLAADDPGQDVGDGEPVLLAGGALAAGLHGQEAGHAGGDGGEVVGVGEDEEPGGAEARAGGLHRPIAERGVELVAGEERVGHPDRTAWIGRPGPADGLDDLRQRGAHLELGDAGPPSSTAHGAERPCRATRPVPTWRNQVAPSARMPGMLAMVSALLTSVGAAAVCPPGLAMTEPAADDGSSPDVLDAVAVGRGDAGEGLSAVEHLEQGRLLAVEILGRALAYDHGAVGPPGVLDLGQGGAEPLELGAEGGLEGEHDAVRIDRFGGDECPFDDPVGVAAQEHPVLEGTRLALGGVDHH